MGSAKIVSNCARLKLCGDLISQMLHIAHVVLHRRFTLTCSTVGAITLKCLVTWFSYRSRATDGNSLTTSPNVIATVVPPSLRLFDAPTLDPASSTPLC